MQTNASNKDGSLPPFLLTPLLWDFTEALRLYCSAVFDYFSTKHLKIETKENLFSKCFWVYVSGLYAFVFTGSVWRLFAFCSQLQRLSVECGFRQPVVFAMFLCASVRRTRMSEPACWEKIFADGGAWTSLNAWEGAWLQTCMMKPGCSKKSLFYVVS